jgi:glycosyltransferase involved in cell wall biosynthesis
MNSSTRIKICFVAPKAYPLFNPDAKNVKNPFGGSEVDLYLLAMELAKDENFEINFIVADYGQGDTETFGNVKVIKSLNFDKNAFSGMFRIWSAMRKADAGIYIIKTASTGVPLVAFFCWLTHRAFVYRTASRYECDGEYARRYPLLGRAFNRSLKSAKLVFTQNQTDRENLLRTIGVSSIFIRNGHCIEQLISNNRDIILWAGRSDSEKRPQLFLDLAEQFPDEKFVMLCPKALNDQNYGQLVSRAKTIKNLEFLPLVPFQKTSDYFRHAKVFVCTSQAEGFPNTYIQAWINAVPVLSLDVNPDGLFDKFGCGICCRGDLGRFAGSLRFMLAENKYAQLGRNGRKYAEEYHDIKKIAEEYKKLFTEIQKSGFTPNH